jgi:hypothetical protein
MNSQTASEVKDQSELNSRPRSGRHVTPGRRPLQLCTPMSCSFIDHARSPVPDISSVCGQSPSRLQVADCRVRSAGYPHGRRWRLLRVAWRSPSRQSTQPRTDDPTRPDPTRLDPIELVRDPSALDWMSSRIREAADPPIAPTMGEWQAQRVQTLSARRKSERCASERRS